MRSDAYIFVSCDKCGYEERYELTPLARGGWDARYLNKYLEREHWIVNEDGEDVCSECSIEDPE